MPRQSSSSRSQRTSKQQRHREETDQISHSGRGTKKTGHTSGEEDEEELDYNRSHPSSSARRRQSRVNDRDGEDGNINQRDTDGQEDSTEDELDTGRTKSALRKSSARKHASSKKHQSNGRKHRGRREQDAGPSDNDEGKDDKDALGDEGEAKEDVYIRKNSVSRDKRKKKAKSKSRRGEEPRMESSREYLGNDRIVIRSPIRGTAVKSQGDEVVLPLNEITAFPTDEEIRQMVIQEKMGARPLNDFDEKVYIEGSRKFKIMKFGRAQASAGMPPAGGKGGSTHERLAPVLVFLFACLSTIGDISLGIMAGLSVGHLVSISWFSKEFPIQFLGFYSAVSNIDMNLWTILFYLALIWLYEWNMIQNKLRHLTFLKRVAFNYSPLFVYAIALIIQLSMIGFHDRLYFYHPSHAYGNPYGNISISEIDENGDSLCVTAKVLQDSWPPGSMSDIPEAMLNELQQWGNLSMARSILCIIGWVIVKIATY